MNKIQSVIQSMSNALLAKSAEKRLRGYEDLSIALLTMRARSLM